jgi:flagellum-specific peptidoglycan hydrolase FlgJ
MQLFTKHFRAIKHDPIQPYTVRPFLIYGTLIALAIYLNGCQILKMFRTDPNLSVKNTSDAYINRLLPEAKRIRRKYGVPVDLTLAIAIQETGYGKYTIGQNNHFGLKCKSHDCIGVTTGGQTTQWENCMDAAPCFDTFAQTIKQLAGNDFNNLEKIRQAGYATSPDWTEKVQAVRQTVRNTLKEARKTS